MKYLLILISLCVLCVMFLGCSGKRPDSLGAKDGRLASCPDSPNCVSTQSNDEEHSISPIRVGGNLDAVMAKANAAIVSMKGNVIKNDGAYLHAEFTSKIIRFVDDLECIYIEDEGLLHVRSASRVGYSDLGVNRKRIEQLRSLLESSD